MGNLRTWVKAWRSLLQEASDYKVGQPGRRPFPGHWGWPAGADTGESTAHARARRSVTRTLNARDDGSTRIGCQFMTL